jgi:hypothetical protein
MKQPTNGQATTTPPPVIERLEDLRRQLADTGTALASAEAALREGTGDAEAVVRAEARAPVLRKAIAELEQHLATDREAAGQAAAQKRMIGIARAHGSVRQELDDDDAKVREAAVAYKEAADRVNARYRGLEMLRAEANALADRFGVAAPTFPPVVIPAMREGCAAAVMEVQVKFLDHAHVSPATEKDEHGLRSRRNFAEIAATPGGQIIATVGPKPWPELTDKQREIIAGQERQQAQEVAELRRFATEANRGLQRSVVG